MPYPDAVAAMQERVAAIAHHGAREWVWLLQHPPLYTAGTSASADELLENTPFPVYETGRGGRYTYHGPGQRVAYVLLNLRARDGDVRAHIARLEAWVIKALADVGVAAARREGRIGLWVAAGAREEKIAAIGVRVTRGVAWHGVAVNVDPDLSHFGAIVPCGLRDYGVTSLRKLGLSATMAQLDAALKNNWDAVFQVPLARQG